jgi:hypothetical protein
VVATLVTGAVSKYSFSIFASAVGSASVVTVKNNQKDETRRKNNQALSQSG